MPAPKHILAIRFSAMGDVAMTVPVIRAVLEQNPEVIITIVSRPEFASFFLNIPRLHYFAADLEVTYKGFGGLIRLFRTLKKDRRYYALADLHDNLRTKVIRKLFGLSGLPYAFVDKGREEKRQLTRFPGKVLVPLKPTTARYADVFEKIGIKVTLDNQLVKNPPPLAGKLLKITGDKTNTWIGIAPFAKHKGKIYPLERTEMVIESLNKKNVRIFLFGGSVQEEEVCFQWQQKYSSVTSLVRRITMEEELTIISRLDVMMSMDSAGMHLASMEGIPVISVWGATHHYAGFLGYGQSENNIVADDIECRPCSIYGNKPCFRKDYACLYNIAPETIIKSLEKFIR
ncbi:glycosyltransferase family 9 protein [Mucilaginibacter xinganensis]|uniref:Heptosyltransferase n=1 Tax=Mucilaginibacter xinganensis TaxID=1234841 RepID=A0A223NW74_9SPHI|nr:glycosyltransferase family 9 protein [Mucilaginibacter xinganensis]ASU33781.1 hypothetical protein MuYL_1885 [Mucilaginibacter xinganensis]